MSLAVAGMLLTSLSGTASADTAVVPDARIKGGTIGELPAYTLLTHPLSDRVALEVNAGNGNVILRSLDLDIQGTGLDYQLVRYWNSRATGAGAFGAGGSMSNGADVRLDIKGSTVTLYAASGFSATYTAGQRGSYASPNSYRKADLVKNGDGTYTLTQHESGDRQTFDSKGRLTAASDAEGDKVTFAYDGSGQVTKATDTQNRSVSFTYQSGRVTEAKDSSGRSTRYSYTDGRLTEVTDGAGAKWRLSYYDGAGNLNQIVDPRGNTTTLAYDATHRATAITYADYTDAAAKTTYSYASKSTTVTDPLGHATTYSVDGASRVTKVVDAQGNSRELTYDATGNVTATTDPSTAVTTYTYLVNDQLASIQQPSTDGGADGAKTTFSYDDAGHPYRATAQVDSQGNQGRYTYNGPGNLTTASTFNPDGTPTSSGNTVSRVYQGDKVSTTGVAKCGAKTGQLCWEVDARGNKTTYGFDALGNVISITSPAPLGKRLFTYDGLSRVSTSTDGKGVKRTYAYDNDDRITKVSPAGGPAITYGYDGNGNLVSRSDATGTTTYSYDATNHLTYKTPPAGWARSYTYDLAGNLTSAADSGGPAGSVTYAYDSANELTSVTEPGGAKTTIAWAHARRSSQTYPNGVKQDYGYDTAGRLTSITASKDGTVLTDYTGTYGDSGGADRRLLQTIEDSAAGATTAYRYDGLNELTSASTSGSGGHSYEYLYDPSGNRTQSVRDGVYSAIDTFNAADQLVDRGGAQFGGYDANGNATSDGTGQSYSYNVLDQTTSMAPPGGAALNVAYSDADQTERVSLGSTTMVNGMFGVDQETKAGATTYYVRDNEGNLVSERTPGGTYYYLFDLRGSVVGLTSADGTKVNTYTYDPYGAVTSSASDAPIANPWRFNAGYYDVDTKLYKFGLRYYDPSLGRFTQLDPTSLESNEYAYAKADPVNRADPSGAWSWSLECVGGLIATTVAAGTAVSATVASGGLAAPVVLPAAGAVGAGLITAGACT